MYSSPSPSDQIRSDQSLSRVQLFVTPWIAALQASLSITNSRSSLRLTSIESVMPSSHLILCRPLLLLPPIRPSIRVFSNESTLCMKWPKYWSFGTGVLEYWITGISALASFLTKKSQGWTPSLLDHSWSLLSCLQVLVWWSCLARQLSYDFKKCFVKIVNIWVYFLILCLCFLHFKQYSSKEFITFTRLPERPRHKKD